MAEFCTNCNAKLIYHQI